MRIKETKVYPFDELSDEIKRKGCVAGLWDINIWFEWWESTYEDAAQAKLKLTEFDIGRENYCRGEFIEDAKDTAREIIKQHGKNCETFKTAAEFLSVYHRYIAEDSEESEDADCCRREFKVSILEDYRIILQKEYEYLTSEDVIIETIKANEYEFTVDGKLA